MYDASVIVVSYNKLPYTRLCLERLLEADPIPAQIIVVDNGSQDGSVQYIEDEFSDCAAAAGVSFIVVRNETNLGACTARNQALQAAGGQYISFMDNDVAVRSRNWLATLGEFLEREKEVGIVGPKLVFPFAPFDIECAGAAISPQGRVQYRGRGQPLDTTEFSQATEVQCLISACWLMERELYDQLGGLDEVFSPAQYEDFDFCYRARQVGWQVWYEPVVEMYHYEGVTTADSTDINYEYVTIRNGLEFKRRWQHMFVCEDGPADEECQWQQLDTQSIQQAPWPPVV